MGERGAPVNVDRGERVSASCAVALLVFMFAFAWYGVDQMPGRVSGRRVVTTANAWDGLMAVRWVMLVTILVALGSVVLHWHQRGHGARTLTGPFVAVLGLVTALLLVFRVLIDPPASAEVPDQKLGAILGLFAAFGVAIGGWDSVRAARPGPRRQTRMGADAAQSGGRVTSQ
jgi:hypothetical protein